MTTPDEISVAQQTIEGYLSKWRVAESNLRAAVATNVSLQDSLSRAVAERQSFYTELIDARNEIDRLNKIINPVPHITFGLSNPDPRIGDLVERTYSKTVIGAPPKVPVMHSFKTWDQAAVTAWVKAAPAGSVIIYYHEPEDNIEAGGLKMEDLQTRTIALAQTVIDCKRVGEVRPATCFMQYSLAAGPTKGPARLKMVTDIMSPAVVSKLKEAKGIGGWDCYAGPSSEDGPDRTPEDLFGKCANFSANLGLPWGVYEYGAVIGPTSPENLHAVWLQSVFDYLGSGKIQPPLHFVNWNQSAPGVNKTYSVAILPKVLAVFQAAVKKYGG